MTAALSLRACVLENASKMSGKREVIRRHQCAYCRTMVDYSVIKMCGVRPLQCSTLHLANPTHVFTVQSHRLLLKGCLSPRNVFTRLLNMSFPVQCQKGDW